MFVLTHSTTLGRRGILRTAHGDLQTPLFLPVATAGAMRGIGLRDLTSLGAQVLLCNTYHLHLRPGEHIIAEAGGLHSFIGWEKPILTDSGGFQVFSLRHLSSITDEGVHFRSHLDGTPLFLGPEEAMHIQHHLGSDMMMCLDQCSPSLAPRAEQVVALKRTVTWAAECKKLHQSLLQCKNKNRFRNPKSTKNPRSESSSGSSRSGPIAGSSDAPASSSSLLFAIIQGGLERDLRETCAEELVSIGFDGYAIGGLAVGETEEEMFQVIDAVCPLLPPEKPRYLMGVGRIEQMRVAVSKGIDMFDCVLPMREARHGTVSLSGDSVIRITRSDFAHDHSVIDPDSPSVLSRIHNKSYLRYLLQTGERYGETIACMQNLGVTLKVLADLRHEIDERGRRA